MESESEESGCFQIVGVVRRSGRINQSQCMFPHFVIGLVLLLLLPTPTVWFSPDHKRDISNGVISRLRMLFSLDHKLYTSDYDSKSDSVTSENQSYYGRFFWSQRNHISYHSYLYGGDTFVIQTLESVPLVSTVVLLVPRMTNINFLLTTSIYN